MKSYYTYPFFKGKINIQALCYNGCLLMLMILNISCKKLIEVKPPITFTNADQVYSDDTKAAAVLTGIYNNLSQNPLMGSGASGISFYAGLSSDELGLYTPSNQQDKNKLAFYTNSLSSTRNIGYWTSFYPIIFIANTAIEGLSDAAELTPAVRKQLLGEAKFIRAFCYFYLVNLYGDVPLAITTDYKVNGLLPRTSKVKVYEQIVADLKDAQNLLSNSYLDATLLKPTNERVRPTRWAATALLARVYLYMNDYVNAEVQSTTLINYSALYSLATLQDTFLKNSTEAIWQLQPVRSGQNTPDALVYILPSTGPNINDTHPVYLSKYVIDRFEEGDQRKNEWVGNVTSGNVTYYFPFKYKINAFNRPVAEYSMVLRLGEQYLIRAEARAQQNNILGSIEDLNTIRHRAGGILNQLPNTLANDKPSLLLAIEHERQVELFTEWGHRWLDLKRIGKVDEVMSVVTPIKGGVWNSNLQWYPIALTQLQLNPNLKQNDGYN